MRLVATVQFLPAALRPKELFLVGVVVLRREGHQRDQLLEGKESGITVHGAEHVELIAKETVHFAPCARVEHAACEIRSTHRDLLRHAGAHADEADQVHVAKTQVIEQPDRIVGVQGHRRGDGRIVARLADAPIIENDHLIAFGQAAREVVVIVATKTAPTAHAQHRIALTDHFVVHVVVVDACNGHEGSGQKGLVIPRKAMPISRA